ncbi:hypothetical protein J7E95_21415 [Streptomyces sp. ISL-14]|uniref:hypothetical protein n=1 Tax=Bacillus sp. ISL-4 TaxID=2819125 RepID=UPI001C1C5ABB|nr:hypothetical protein [Bacillus sp. ISL-4]MBT2673349.1 hypothetical protein [Streptomyces sp. ISL-14]
MRKYIDWGSGLLVFSREANVDYLYLQNRCAVRKDYLNLLAHETVYDGVREIKEEIGIDVSFDELVPRRFHRQRTGKRLSI